MSSSTRFVLGVLPVLVWLAVSAPAVATAQSGSAALALADTVQQLAHAAFLHDDLAAFERARERTARGLERHPDDALLLHYLGYIDFRMGVLQLQSRGSSAEVKERLDTAIANLTRALEFQPMAESHALLSATIGIRASIGSRLAAPFELRRANRAMDRALELDGENPRVWLVRGINAAQLPGFLGGGSDRARTALEKAIELFDRDAARPPMPVWGHAEAYAWLGVIHARNGDTALAREAYETALRIEPESNRVRHVLLPRLDRAIGTPND